MVSVLWDSEFVGNSAADGWGFCLSTFDVRRLLLLTVLPVEILYVELREERQVESVLGSPTFRDEEALFLLEEVTFLVPIDDESDTPEEFSAPSMSLLYSKFLFLRELRRFSWSHPMNPSESSSEVDGQSMFGLE